MLDIRIGDPVKWKHPELSVELAGYFFGRVVGFDDKTAVIWHCMRYMMFIDRDDLLPITAEEEMDFYPPRY